jgi:hypothetical protein
VDDDWCDGSVTLYIDGYYLDTIYGNCGVSAGFTIDAPVSGCTDSNASNYDVNANLDDGSCTYASEFYCADGVDEDLDGNTDCADTDCAAEAACAPGASCAEAIT